MASKALLKRLDAIELALHERDASRVNSKARLIVDEIMGDCGPSALGPDSFSDNSPIAQRFRESFQPLWDDGEQRFRYPEHNNRSDDRSYGTGGLGIVPDEPMPTAELLWLGSWYRTA